MYCKFCGAPMEDNHAFCTNCGAKRETPQVVAEETPSMNTEVIEIPAETPAVTPAVTPVETPAVTSAEDNAIPGNSFCTNCGAQVYPNAVICVKCGAAIKGMPKKQKNASKKEKTPKPKKKISKKWIVLSVIAAVLCIAIAATVVVLDVLDGFKCYSETEEVMTAFINEDAERLVELSLTDEGSDGYQESDLLKRYNTAINIFDNAVDYYLTDYYGYHEEYDYKVDYEIVSSNKLSDSKKDDILERIDDYDIDCEVDDFRSTKVELKAKGNGETFKMNITLYFVKVDGSWKLFDYNYKIKSSYIDEYDDDDYDYGSYDYDYYY